MATSSVSLKLLIDTKSKKVLFAEAGKDFVDFLFNLLSLPLGTATRLLTKKSMVGCFGNIYGSVETINESYLLQPEQKDTMLCPKSLSNSQSQVPLLLDFASLSRKFYCCSGANYYYHFFVADDPEALCPTCKAKMSREFAYVAKSKTQVTNSGNSTNEAEMGFVKGVVTYMVMDNLEVKPMSTISSITMLNNFNIKEIGALQEKVVHVDMAQGVKLLKASLQSKTVLTSVFLCG